MLRRIGLWDFHHRLLGAALALAAVPGCNEDYAQPAPRAAYTHALVTETPSANGKSADPNAAPVITTDIHSTSGSHSALVNVYGEINGVGADSSRAGGEAGFEQHSFADEGFDSDVCIDPSGKWMLFTSTRNSVHPNIYLQRVDGVSVIQLTNDDADYAYPTFSPDGKQIAFSSTRGGNWDIYMMDLDGKNVVQITTGPTQHVHPSFNPDATKLVYSSLGAKSQQWELWTVDLVNGEKRMIGFGLFPTWCPVKGVDRIAFQRARQRGGRWFSLWTLELVDGEAHRVTEVAASTNAAIVSPSWSPDGTMLAFSTIAGASGNPTSGISADKPTGQQDVWTINSDGSNRHRLTDGLGINLGPCWSTDDRVYFISDRSGTECIWSAKFESDTKQSKVADKNDSPDAPATPSAPEPKPVGNQAIGSTTPDQ
jgi:TolB protein